ncbi:type II secretion system F family protein [Halomonas aquamarina]|uniref:Type II secretion system F family protein n=1 Tax=Vreelandella aquamarina TaxID=77097 RepID=A0ACC5VU30_9GAMM|nr:type II secretion system F family protein [Halomonas aquamarina]MBZ5487044.1 type II secretion system F family protein [Halomonas aquamarina]
MWLLIMSAVLLLAAAALVVWTMLQQQRNAAIISQRISTLGGVGLATNRRRSLLEGLEQLDGRIDAELPRLLEQLGWRSPQQRARYYAIQMGVPLIAAVLAMAVSALWRGEPSFLAALACFGIGFLLPKRWLRRAVGKRRERIAEEVSTMLPLLRMLFEVGMSVEQALRALTQEGQYILPELSVEFKRVLTRVDVGLDLASELTSMAERLDIDQVTDCVVILEQLIRQGGGAVASLISLKQLFDDRRMTTLQEKVSKLSAKMSATMVAFLFPALLIILAGPGFIAIFGALSGMSP